MSSPFGDVFNGRTVARLTIVPRDPQGGRVVVVGLEFTDGSTLSIVTDTMICGTFKLPAQMCNLSYMPGTFTGGGLKRPRSRRKSTADKSRRRRA